MDNKSSKEDTNKKKEISSYRTTKEDIVSELIKFNVATKEEIMSAINMVKNKNDINEIIDYIYNHKQKQIISTISNVEYTKQICSEC